MKEEGYVSFVVRLWQKFLIDESPEWRGEVESIQSGSRWSFPTVAPLIDFLRLASVTPPSYLLPDGIEQERNTTMVQQHQDLASELRERELPSLSMRDDETRPISSVCGSVDAGAALYVANESTAAQSIGIDVRVGASDSPVRNVAISAIADPHDGIGLIARGDYGVVGQSNNTGVMGFGSTGVFGLSNDPAGRGVEGHATGESSIGVLASAVDATTTALAINNGSFRVLNAGENTPTPVFVHVASELNTRASQTIINHPMTNNDPNAILIVTRREILFPAQDENGITPPITKPEVFSVAYSVLAERWLIIQPAHTLLPLGTAFNIFIVKC